ncbi:MAG: serine hydroxymethyltransferase [Candidatus Thorarchaeota archaeon]
MCAEIAQKILATTKDHEAWRKRCLNLIPSENLSSPHVRAILGSDFGHRYAWDEPWYGGQKYTVQVEALAVQAAKKLYRAEYANVRPLSGHLSLMAVIMGLCKPNDSIVISHFENGGYPLNLQARFPLDVHYFPYKEDKYSMDVPGAAALIEQIRPRLVILGASLIPKAHPVKALVKVVRDVDSVLAYDGSHVLGLIAGGQFQDPFQEGADILLGSTHKTFFGPQGGIVLVKEDVTLAEQIDITMRPNPVLVDNYHHHRVAALAFALAEMLMFSKAYAKQVVDNAKQLAQALHQKNVELIGQSWGFTESHQVIIDTKNERRGQQMCAQLEEADIIADAGVRLGSQEITRRGMKQNEMKQIAELIAQRLLEKEPVARIKAQVHSLAEKFQGIEYCFDF